MVDDSMVPSRSAFDTPGKYTETEMYLTISSKPTRKLG
jgi:hypothetical protein